MSLQSRYFSQVPPEDDLRGGELDPADAIDVPEVDLNPVPPAERPLPSKGVATLQGLNPLLLLLLIPVLLAGVFIARHQVTATKAGQTSPAVAGAPTGAAATGLGTAVPKAPAAAAGRSTARPGATTGTKSATGAASAQDVQGAGSTKPTGLAAVNAAANLRSGPGTSFKRIGSASPGQQVQVTGRNQTGDWLQLASGAWIAAFLVDNAPLVPVAPGAPTPPPPTPPRT